MNCYLCGEDNAKCIHEGTRDIQDLKVMKCQNCGLVFLSSFNHMSDEFYETSGMQNNSKINFKEWQEKTFIDDSRRYSFLKDILKNKKLLDFGCGNGGFLELSQNITNCSHGVELDEQSRQYLNGKNIVTTKSIVEQTESFDIITMFHVIEHLDNPISMLNELKEYITGGAINYRNT